MLQPRICRPSLASSASTAESSLTSLAAALNSLALCSKHATSASGPSSIRAGNGKIGPTTFVRYAQHAAQGRANGPKDSAGRRLGAKKTASEFVIPGHIIFKQRGTKWFPGENVGIGKDHTIYAMQSGYVRYYRNPAIHPKRRYIGVALEREGQGSQLPTPPNAPSRRRLGMHAAPIKMPRQDDNMFLANHLSANSINPNTTSSAASSPTASSEDGQPPIPTPAAAGTPTGSANFIPLSSRFRDDNTYRETNYSLGRPEEKKGRPVRQYDRGDRWLAWRKRAKRVKAGMLARAARRNQKGGKVKGKKSNKGQALAGPGKRRL